ncbi:UDP-N-acetylglucosamine 1-carboxyvinyltransferase [Chlorobaculum parvum NCIB 8327]|uniref:UDP-N-acetylglucosamine 1-carboxyvinyltransferase n=1 Tax=Chlorobaculum parvum (strain DSM 263 / NCIMB 8327) TaxID=517417 RepID=MURA_CHLP8|nr:UDP-N-acetylglucosamine 1-carboxyvinyltransferase [Chlorobaculum parvum]B3QM48.1 RecName: Full=UDP-N-acetylglucosamine 1-carboxyvinyltransferase; AltName: Full=Enoylpyruvate transferase; AltName: Full=UDP-N-acetylglucosamine enolpyruvyl transferase; Short=EPT [Chlorobaculum parvum NCIB 8327]ACF11001.1 UDP-N-acetylglucosamine 1-carboxyvinyltransferase [Chlorobaculum parvum NCIB 8327]
MNKLVIRGGKKLSGTVAASGSKNSALPVIAATLLTPDGTFGINRIPDLKDVRTFIQLLEYLGAAVSFENNRLEVSSSDLKSIEAPYELVKKMRASIYVLGPLLARFGHTRVSLPGGCAFGPRPVDLHIMAMEKLGATVTIEQGFIDAKVNGSRLRGAEIDFPISSVGATGNALMAAVTAEGKTVLQNAALEPEIECLCRFLQKMGANISGIGTTTLVIEGVDQLKAVEFDNIFDRIEAGTLLGAAAITGGSVTVTGTVPEHLGSVLDAFRQAGCIVTVKDDAITLTAPEELQPVDITARPYPEFPTDMQAQWMALMTQAHGDSTIIDRIYLERFNHLPELNRLGAHIEIRDNWALVHGPQELTGTKVMSTDLRASACLVLAGLVAKETTEVLRVYHLDRGYESIEKKLSALGADIKREQYQEFS